MRGPFMIIINQQQIQEIVRHSRDCLPNEGCGLLGGIWAGECKMVKKVYLLRNIDESPKHFSMDAREQFAAVADMRKNGWNLLGNFHSHPATPSRPSLEDVRLAFDPSLSYLILSLLQPDCPVLNSFLICSNDVKKEKMIHSEWVPYG